MNTDFKNKIINGDSLEELKKIPSETFDLVFADPPSVSYTHLTLPTTD